MSAGKTAKKVEEEIAVWPEAEEPVKAAVQPAAQTAAKSAASAVRQPVVQAQPESPEKTHPGSGETPKVATVGNAESESPEKTKPGAQEKPSLGLGAQAIRILQI